MRHITWKRGMSSSHTQEVRERCTGPSESLKQLIRLPCWGCGEALGCGCRPAAHLSCPLLRLTSLPSSQASGPGPYRVTPPPVGSRQDFKLGKPQSGWLHLTGAPEVSEAPRHMFWPDYFYFFLSLHEEINHQDLCWQSLHFLYCNVSFASSKFMCGITSSPFIL